MAHYYTRDGELVDCTIREVKKYGYFPSVTTILKMYESYGLTVWKIKQGILAGINNAQNEGESDEDYIARLLDVSGKESEVARNLGQDTHARIEAYLKGEGLAPVENDPQLEIMSNAGIRWCKENIKDVIAVERIYVDPDIGAGCRIDLMARMVDGTVALIDFKTQRFKNGKHTAYDDNLNQLAAEKLIIGDTIDKCINVYIASNEEDCGKVETHEWTDAELHERALFFMYSVEVYKIIKGINNAN